MATAPQFVAVVNKGTPATLSAANTSLEGVGATGRALVFTAGANGSLLPAMRFLHLTSNASQTVARVFRNNGSDPEVAANNALIGEITIAVNTLSQSSASTPYELPLNVKLAGGVTPERIYVTLGTAANIKATPINGGDF